MKNPLYIYILLLISIFSTGCPGDDVDKPTSDATPPAVRVGTAGMKPELLASTDNPTVSPKGRANKDTQILIAVTAEDTDSGIRNVSLTLSMTLVCATDQEDTTTTRTWSETSENHVSDPSATTFPKDLTATKTHDIASLREQCPARKFISVTIRTFNKGENSFGQQSSAPEMLIFHSGPDALRVATLNQYQPGMPSDDKPELWDILKRWGQELYRDTDIVFLTEAKTGDHVRFLSRPDISGLPFYAVMQDNYSTDVAILSRYSLTDIHPIRIGRNNILTAKTMIENIPHLLIGVHWWKNGETSNPSRVETANHMLGIIHNAGMPTFVGGDLNTNSGDGPEGPLPSVPTEYQLLAGALNDTYIMFQPRPPHCSNSRLDYIFFKGHYAPMDYVCKDATPSDHPFVVVNFKVK